MADYGVYTVGVTDWEDDYKSVSVTKSAENIEEEDTVVLTIDIDGAGPDFVRVAKEDGYTVKVPARALRTAVRLLDGKDG